MSEMKYLNKSLSASETQRYSPEALKTEAVIDTSVGLITFYQTSNLIQPFLFSTGHYPSPLIRVMNALVLLHARKKSYIFECHDVGHSSDLSGNTLPTKFF